MAGLKSFLQVAAPVLGVTSAALYERQRALVGVGALEAKPGRGPGSGVPFTSENFAAIVISLLATDSLSEVDGRMISLFEAVPDDIHRYSPDLNEGHPTFLSEVAALLSGKRTRWEAVKAKSSGRYCRLRVSRQWRGQIEGTRGAVTYLALDQVDKLYPPISISAELEGAVISKLITLTQGALTQVRGEHE